jgi:Tol biopolymer transport system component/DNA-binding winged helix-turn-helix (wHTH) protein
MVAMSITTSPPFRIRFGLFEADMKAGELWKAGHRVKLQSQPFKVLKVLLENAGEIVSREELQLQVWGPDVVVDFEHSLGSAIKKVREALGDLADNPRFIETLARRGYRFIAPVQLIEDPAHGEAAPLLAETSQPIAIAYKLAREETAPLPGAAAVVPSRWSRYGILILTFAAGVLLSAIGIRVLSRTDLVEQVPRISRITQEGRVYSSVDISFESLPATVTDGTRLFISSIEEGRNVLSQVSISTGDLQILPLPNEITAPEINDISPGGTELLVRSHPSAVSENPLWVVPVSGGSAFRVWNILAHDATWMPDGKNILYASGNQLTVVSPETGKSTPFATTPARAFWLRWSPNGKVLRFTVIDSTNHTSSLWEVSGSHREARTLLKNWGSSQNECCGIWTADGKRFVFQTTSEGHSDLWVLHDSDVSDPVRLTDGPLYYEAPTAGRTADQVFFVGHDYRSQVERYDARQKHFVPLQGFLSHADRISFSRDQQRVAWVDPIGRLWRAKVDGTDKVQLTSESMQVFLAVWSPDGTQLALMARRPGQTWQIFVENANGGNTEHLMSPDRNVADPSFSPDGKFLAFGGVPELMGPGNTPRAIEILELATGRITEIPNSQGLFSPRWSPDGQYIAALTLNQQKIMLYDVRAQSWKVLAVTSAADPVWSFDGKSIYVHAYMAPMGPICLISVPDGRIEQIASLKDAPQGTVARYFFSGIEPDGTPLVHAETDDSNLYMMDLTPPQDTHPR